MSIHQEITFEGSSEQVFNALTKADNFSKLTGAPAEIDATSGGKFSCFGGMITGLTIEIETNSLLVQAWRAGNWDKSLYSIVKFDLEKVSDTETKLVFDHTGYPDDQKEHLEQGWNNQYWEPMKKYFTA